MPTLPQSTRRRHPRALCSEIVRLSYRDQTGRTIRETGLVEDVGRNGLRVSVSLPVHPEKEVQFETGGFSGFARVCYCAITDSGFAWGLEFPIGAEWDVAVWRPEHLFEIPAGARR